MPVRAIGVRRSIDIHVARFSPGHAARSAAKHIPNRDERERGGGATVAWVDARPMKMGGEGGGEDRGAGVADEGYA